MKNCLTRTRMQTKTQGETAGVWAKGDVKLWCQLCHFDNAIPSEAAHDDGVVLAWLGKAWKREKHDEKTCNGKDEYIKCTVSFPKFTSTTLLTHQQQRRSNLLSFRL